MLWSKMCRASTEAEAETIAEDNCMFFDEVLVKYPEWGAFFTRFENLEVGAKIGQGGQAEIFAAKSPSFKIDGHNLASLVAKVFNKGVSLKNLERQCPPPNTVLSCERYGWRQNFPAYLWRSIHKRWGVKNRFAFVMHRRWSDLRTDNDLRMLRSKSHGPSFEYVWSIYDIIFRTNQTLQRLHKAGVLLRDIKASNVLLLCPHERVHRTVVIDYECSVGVSGTGFWRAPEILAQLQKGVPSHELVFTRKADIYSFGMMCYEIVTGCIPFEGHPLNDNSIVLSGQRSELPHNFDPLVKEIIKDCWHHNSQFRSISFEMHLRFFGLLSN